MLSRYGLYLFIPVFLFIAYSYISSQPLLYKISAKIALKGVSQESAINDLQSKALIGKTLGQLPFQASYFYSDAPKKEIYPDSSPVKMIFRQYGNTSQATLVSMQTVDDRQFTLSRGDTSEFHKFNEPVTESYGSFIVIRNIGADSVHQAVNVKITPPAQLVSQFFHDLRVAPDHEKDVLKLTLVAGNPQKGINFLNTLFRLYGNTVRQPEAAEAADNTNTAHTETVVKPDKNLTDLTDKAAQLGRDIDRLKAEEKSQGTSVRVRRAPLDKNQARIYASVDSYIKRPIDEFVQIPYVDEIEDPDLNDQVNEFNETELSRQHLTSTQQTDSVNRKLMTLRSNIVETINGYLKNEGSDSNTALSREHIEAIIQSKQQSLAQVNKDIETAGFHTSAVVKTEKVKPVAASSPVSGLIVLDKPEDSAEAIPVNSLLIYGIAFIAGIFFPFAGWVIRSVRRNSSSRKLLDKEKLSEKLNDIFAVKQID